MDINLENFIKRLKRLNIIVELSMNFPWIYLMKVNGKIVTEKYQSKNNFTLGFLPIKKDDQFKFTDLIEIFKIIRKYK